MKATPWCASVHRQLLSKWVDTAEGLCFHTKLVAQMNRRDRERFKEFCEHAEVQNQPEKLAKLALQIAKILESEVAKLKKNTKPASA